MANDEAQKGVIDYACREALLSVLAPQCATDLSTTTCGWTGPHNSRIPVGIVEDALMESLTGEEPQLLGALREQWSRFDILTHL